ncbi:hypothetical protein [Candidatus Francisella endociliophora]|nr:hypothetical protein [Francisella sp. FSC1006]
MANKLYKSPNFIDILIAHRDFASFIFFVSNNRNKVRTIEL